MQQALTSAGHTPAALRAYALRVPFCHLKDVFDANALIDTPLGFYPVPDTPSSIAGRGAALAAQAALGMESVSYGTENDGHLFVNLVTIPGEGAFAEKSRKSMRGHTDAVTFPFNGEDDPQNERIAPSPDIVSLVGLRNPKNVPTKVMPLEAVLARLSTSDIEELKKPQYMIRSQKTFIESMKRILGKEHVIFAGPILKSVPTGTFIRYSHTSTTAPDGKADDASKKLEAACNQIAVPIMVKPGDLLLINNRLSLHGRGEVGGEIGGQSRWLLRTYGLDTSNLPAHKRHLGRFAPHVLYP